VAIVECSGGQGVAAARGQGQLQPLHETEDTQFFILHLTDLVYRVVSLTMKMNMPTTVKELLFKTAAEITSVLGGIYEHSEWVAEELIELSVHDGTTMKQSLRKRESDIL
jgi:hypothetical protein